ncbi:hypothetical protein [Phormidium sp. CCY1219]|jgi:putative peptide zinc metalloprotease protein|uniref:hypothetical protein n=1 Tax=Phormidium sp. CCY1219 TaxID=2886104 RepID=UPI002D1F5803|nr:hypothetical protein [Phormidium sp. CCY1219]MEB3826244.1 hypothetical protein [Phormidium sp. CCY1219]
MNSQNLPLDPNYRDWLSPNLGTYWQLAKVKGAEKIVLRSREENTQVQFSLTEGFALQHFTGKLTLAQIQQRCEKKFGDRISPTFVEELLQKLIDLNILHHSEAESPPTEAYHSISEEWICPDLTPYWSVSSVPDSDQMVLKATEGNLRVIFSAPEGYALQYFTGQFTVGQIQDLSQQHFGDKIPKNFIAQLLQKLIELNILQLPNSEIKAESAPKKAAENSPRLKASVQFIDHPGGYWILRNPEDMTFLQVSDDDKAIIDQLGRRSTAAILAEFCISKSELKHLLKLLTITAMLEGTTPPPPPKRKFNPMQLLYFRIPLFNPDPWLNRHIDRLRWIWTKPFAFLLFSTLAFSAIIGVKQRDLIFHTGQQLIQAHGGGLIIPFALLSMLVVSLHELGHAFTLKNFGGVVPKMGLLIIMCMPAAYTNTTDSYCLSRMKRVLVVGAGLLVQFAIWAIALGLWNWTTSSSWLHIASYLLMGGALVTVAINLNPLAKFDGYYLAVALTGINNLRTRSFALYGNLLTGKPIRETASDALILAIYAPLSLAYIYFVFGFLFARIADWSLTNIPLTALSLLVLWLIYYFFPSDKS